ncbi:MAG TPA: GntR family transcriptional regulator [Acetobacteraceae bacterium]|nr:GntR family transcriptional regulator [Acetobacteraceae bacterium]
MTMLMRISVYEALKTDIIACRLPPGAELREPDLAERYQVSRSPVRDALLRLEADGLVRIVPRQSYRVAPISLRDAADLFQLRRLLEPEAARDAASRKDEIAGALDAAVSYQQGSDFIDYNRRFHCAIAASASNKRLAAACIDCIEQSDRLVRVSLGQIEGRRPDRLVEEHGAIIEAIKSGDGRAAARHLRAHIDEAEARVLGALRRQAVITE